MVKHVIFGHSIMSRHILLINFCSSERWSLNKDDFEI